MMACASKLLFLMALAVMAAEAIRNDSLALSQSLHAGCCGHKPSGLSQKKEARAAPTQQYDWDDFMSEIYGENWADEESSRHLDAARCLQWAVYKTDVPKDNTFPQATDEQLGQRGCMSALVREAIIGSLEKKTFKWWQKTKTYSVLQLDHATDHSSQSNGISVEVRTWEPELCTAIAQTSKKDCQVRVYAVDEFAKLRKSTAMPNRKGPRDFTDKIAKSIESGPLVFFDPGAGKSDATFSRTQDHSFALKMGLRHDSLVDEPKRLLSMVVGTEKASSLLQHLQDNTNSLLNRYFSMVRVKVLGKEKYVLLMGDASYDEDARIQKLKKSGSRLLYTRYDLKGQSRDPDERQKIEKQFTLLNGDFKARENNYLDLTKDQCRVLSQTVRADTAFLDSHNLIDYSLFVGLTNGETGGCKTTPGEPFCFEATKSLTYTFCIIDYASHLNVGKSIANIWHGGKYSNYGQGINKFIGEICPGRKEWYERTAFRIWCAIIVFVLAMAAGGSGLWYWWKLQGTHLAPVKEPVQQVPWQQGSAPPVPQCSAGDDFGIATGQPQGHGWQHGMGGSPVTGRGLA